MEKSNTEQSQIKKLPVKRRKIIEKLPASEKAQVE